MSSIRSGLNAATEVLKAADRNDDDDGHGDDEDKGDRRSGDRALRARAHQDDYKGEIVFDELDENMDESLANLASLIS